MDRKTVQLKDDLLWDPGNDFRRLLIKEFDGVRCLVSGDRSKSVKRRAERANGQEVVMKDTKGADASFI